MNVFIWDRLEKMSENYHSGGGVVVVADSLREARSLLRATNDVPETSDVFTAKPSKVFTLAEKPAAEVFLFPDAGCC